RDTPLPEGRFDTTIQLPLPDPEARRQILTIHLGHGREAVDWEGIDLDEVLHRTVGMSGAALATLVSVAAEQALAKQAKISQAELLGAVGERQARDRTVLEEAVHWQDVVLPPDLEQRLRDIME